MRNGVMKRDILAGFLLCSIGALVVMQALNHAIGTLNRMEAGYLPLVLGILLIGLGIMIAGKACLFPSELDAGDMIHPPDVRGCVAIGTSVIAFALIGKYAGLIPATFVSTVIAAAGDRQMSVKGALALATSLVAVAVILFSYALKVPFPLFRW